MTIANDALRTAFRAAEVGSRVALKYWRSPMKVHAKANLKDVVTIADIETERAIRSIIKRVFPEHGIIGEEGGKKRGEDHEYLWAIDPIDGTVNYAHGEPIFGVSVGLLKRHRPYLGVIVLPALQEFYWAQQGKGAYWKKDHHRPTRCHVSRTRTLRESLFSMGCLTGVHRSQENMMRLYPKLWMKAQAGRIHWSAVFDFANLARGSMDFYINLDLHVWDYAAGWCLVEESGGELVNIKGQPIPLLGQNQDLLATNGRITKAVIAVIQKQ